MSDRIGQLFGNYRLTRLLGQGGFADVYLGEHVHLNTQAALKILRTQLTNGDVVHFRDEARIIAHLEHPHIVQVLDFGVEGNTPFLVMAYAPNGTLRQRHPRGVALPAERIVLYLKQIASALQFAHQQKLIHRDIKPENMLLGRNDDVLLTDFGIALLSPTARAQSLFEQSRTSGLVGTLPYMAPEQIQGQPSLASDQYAFAVVVYEWLCGTPPFTGMPMEIAAKHLSALPPLLREKDPTIPADVEKVVLTALAKDPRQRFATVGAFATALEQAYQRVPSSILMPPPPYSRSAPLGAPEPSAQASALYGPFGYLPLGASTVTIGRTPTSELVLDDLKVSSQHAKIGPIGQGHGIMDLNSTNGTFVNDQWLAPGTPRPLNWGDTIRIGDTTLSYAVESPTPKQALSAVGEPRRLGDPGWVGGNGSALTPRLSPVNTGYGGGAPQGYRSAASSPFSPPPEPPQNTRPFVLVNGASTGIMSSGGQGSEPPLAIIPPGRSPRRNHRLLWLVLSLAAVLLVLAGSTIGVFAYVNSLPTPTKALDAFCTALQSKDYQTGYHQLSNRFQSRTSEALFAGFFANVTMCTHGAATQNGGMTTASLTTTGSGQTSTDQVTLLQDGTNAWKIDDDTSLSGLTKTLDAYCMALQGGDYATAYSQFSVKLQGKLTPNQFKSFFPQPSSCSYAMLALTAGGATTNITTVTASGQTETDMVTLVLSNTSTWKIDDVTNLPDKTLDTFCNALQQQDYQTAYNQTSNAFQGGYPESKFASDFSVFTSCTHDAASASGGNVTANMTLGDGSGLTLPLTAFLIKDSNGKWKIDNLTNLPYQTLDTFCNALQMGDYQTAYDQLSTGYQQRISEQQFASVLSTVTACTHDFPIQSGDSATANIVLTDSTGQKVPFKVFMIKDSNGNWKIDSLQ